MCSFSTGSSNGHSPVLNLSKGGGDHSGSEGGHTGPEDEGDDEENVTDVDEELEEKHHPSGNVDFLFIVYLNKFESIH